MDVLSDVLKHLHVQSELSVRPRYLAPWGLAMAATDDAPFHLMVSGAAVLRVAGQSQPVELHAGDFVLLPGGAAHSLADAADTPLRDAEPLFADKSPAEVAELDLGGRGRESLIVSGCFRFVRHGVHPLLTPLPALIHVPAGEGWRAMMLEPVLQLLTAELASEHPGAPAVVTQLLHVLFLQALRNHIQDHHIEPGNWLYGLRDERVSRALGCMHAEPERVWSTAALAEQAGMSRGAFASLFTSLVGEPPPNYLTRWRIQTALRALSEDHAPLAAVAARVGYPSTAAFTRIFKRMVGMPPAEYRRAAAQGAEPLLRQERPPGSEAVYAAARFRRAR